MRRSYWANRATNAPNDASDSATIRIDFKKVYSI